MHDARRTLPNDIVREEPTFSGRSETTVGRAAGYYRGHVASINSPVERPAVFAHSAIVLTRSG